ncbi:FxSxx-COOH system tetratricopeptide repeat protein [Streptomyces netropsis]|uniref:FxSxx-COOH system tetratricopeptide repeat protein n=1 Tax=Streptomyces netropsis TaxID=55404 RepID=UPI0030CB2B02
MTGDGAVGTQIAHAVVMPPEACASPSSVVCPPGLSNLVDRASLFVGREEELKELDAALAAPGNVVVQAVHGLGGVGKSTLAARWAATRTSMHNPVWWITADSPAALDAGLAGLAVALQPALTDVLGQEALRERAVQWLATHHGWLLVLDDLAEPADIRALVARATTGRFLITSRRASGWHGIATPVALGVLDHSEAVDLFTQILTHDRPRVSDGADEVCAELGYLPLAVEQAAAYCAETGTSPRAYLDLLAQHPAELYADTAEGGDTNRTIARIWHVTLDRLADDPLTGQILRTLAWYAPDGIPRTLLHHLAEPPALLRAIGRLAAHSMLTVDAETGDLSVHRLVQALARTADPHDPHREPQSIKQARSLAIATLSDAFPADIHDPASWPTARVLLPHVEALTSHTQSLPDVDTASLLERMGRFLHGQGAVNRAITLICRALASRAGVLGKDHPSTLASRNNLANAYESAGDLGRAIPLYERTLADQARVLGKDHPNTLISRNNLAGAYRSAGDLGRAIPLYERTLADQARVLGEDHPDTLGSRNNLASAYRSAGDLGRAIPLYERTLADQARVLGKDHPDTLTSRNNLASAYRSAGDLGRAIPMYERTLADRVRVLGEDHPNTLASRNNLAGSYESAGDLGRAIPMYERTLADRVRVLGEDHPNTLTSRNNLAGSYESAGDLGRAIPMYERTLADRVRVLGEDHPDTLGSRNNLAYAYRSAGDLGRAIPLYERTLNDCVRVLGEDHPTTQTVRSNLDVARNG